MRTAPARAAQKSRDGSRAPAPPSAPQRSKQRTAPPMVERGTGKRPTPSSGDAGTTQRVGPAQVPRKGPQKSWSAPQNIYLEEGGRERLGEGGGPGGKGSPSAGNRLPEVVSARDATPQIPGSSQVGSAAIQRCRKAAGYLRRQRRVRSPSAPRGSVPAHHHHRRPLPPRPAALRPDTRVASRRSGGCVGPRSHPSLKLQHHHPHPPIPPRWKDPASCGVGPIKALTARPRLNDTAGGHSKSPAPAGPRPRDPPLPCPPAARSPPQRERRCGGRRTPAPFARRRLRTRGIGHAWLCAPPLGKIYRERRSTAPLPGTALCGYRADPFPTAIGGRGATCGSYIKQQWQRPAPALRDGATKGTAPSAMPPPQLLAALPPPPRSSASESDGAVTPSLSSAGAVLSGRVMPGARTAGAKHDLPPSARLRAKRDGAALPGKE